MSIGRKYWLTALLDLLRISSTSIPCILCANKASSFICSLDVVVGGAEGNGAGNSAIKGIGDWLA
jgi:hypothetical protein